MPSSWTHHDERQYRAILRSCNRDTKTCKRIAAATVNKRRAHGLSGLGWTQAEHRRELRNILRKDVPASRHTLRQARTCTHSILLFQDAVRAREQDISRRGFKSNKVSPKVAALMKRAERALLSNCRERSNRITDFGAREPLRRR